jgi:hypothetical protein
VLCNWSFIQACGECKVGTSKKKKKRKEKSHRRLRVLRSSALTLNFLF